MSVEKPLVSGQKPTSLGKAVSLQPLALSVAVALLFGALVLFSIATAETVAILRSVSQPRQIHLDSHQDASQRVAFVRDKFNPIGGVF